MQSTLRKFFFPVLSLFIFTAEAGDIVSFAPTGSVKKIQQITVRFSSDMKEMGDPSSKQDPFTLECNLANAKKGEKNTPAYTTRWIDNKNWSLDFDKPLDSGIKCTVTKAEALKDLNGQSVNGLAEYTFSTSGPSVLGVAPIYGEIEPEQYFVLLVDGPLNLASVEKNAYFEVDGIPEKVGALIVKDASRLEIIRAAIENNWRWNSYKPLLNSKKKDAISKGLSNFLIISARRRFPEAAKVTLHWPKGILSASGLSVEEPQSFDFNVMSPFVAEFNCERTAADRACNPILNMSLRFSSRVPLKSLIGTKLVSASGPSWVPEELKKGDLNKNVDTAVDTTRKSAVGVKVVSNFADEQVSELTFKAPFPETKKFKLFLPPNIRDELQRPLTNQKKFPLNIGTDEYSPLVKFPATFGILELKGDPLLPINLRNVEKNLPVQQLSLEGKTINLSNKSTLQEIIRRYKEIDQRQYYYEKRNTPYLSANEGSRFQLPKPMGAREFELVGLPLKKPGFYVVELSSPKLGQFLTDQTPMYVATSVLVTDMAVHFKKGRESSLVWVTQLSDAKPVDEAEITLINKDGLEIAKGKTGSNGILNLSGIKLPCSYDDSGYEYDKCEIFVFAKKNDDLSFVSSQWSKGIESYRFNFSEEYLQRDWGPVIFHTVMDRMVAQPGDKVQMKHILREHFSKGFQFVNKKHLPNKVLIVHQGTQKTYTLPFNYDPTSGTAQGNFEIPKEATLGKYTIFLSNKDNSKNKKAAASEEDSEEGEGSFDWGAIETGYFNVSEYRLPLMKAEVKIQGTPLVNPKEVKVDLSASYLSGGPAKNMKVKVRASIQPGDFTPDVPNAKDYSFFAAPQKVGISDRENRSEPEDVFLKVQEYVLSNEGGVLGTLKDIPKVKKIENLNVEMEYADPNGEIKTASSQTPLFPANSIVGLKAEGWSATATKTKVSGVITDTKGKIKARSSYIVEAFLSNYITHRKRLVGGFYSYDSTTEIVALGKVCEGVTDANGLFICEPKKLPAGSIVLQAKVNDEAGRSTYAQTSVSIYEEGADQWWTPSDSDRIDLVPEKTKYEPNEKAKFFVMSPFPTSTVLVTVEREGVLDSFVTEVKRDQPTVEILMKGNYAPNVFISAIALRGRVGDPKPNSLVDLAKPTMKLGMAEVKVGWKAHQLLVDVQSDKKKYHTRDKVLVKIKVKTASGADLSENSEVAVAVVDEALMRLKENSSWDVLKEMMGQRSLAVTTSSGQNQVIGKRHFGSKAKAPGGSGGVMTADNRELFDPIIYWNPKLKLNKRGEADVSFALNDSITSFRVVAVAQAAAQFFGDGKLTIQSSKDLIIYGGFSATAREGDLIESVITIRNTTENAMQVNLEVESKEIPQLPKLSNIELKASEAKVIPVTLKIPPNITEMKLNVSAKDLKTGSSDQMTAKMKILPAVPITVTQATLIQLSKKEAIPFKQPMDSLAEKGGVTIGSKATLVSGLGSLKSYMAEYEYSCLEQKISKAIVLEDAKELAKIIEGMPSYLDSFGLLKFFPTSYCGSSQLNRYVLNILQENGIRIPDDTKQKLISGVNNAIQGTANCANWWDNLVNNPFKIEEKILLMDTLSRYQSFSPELLSTVPLNPQTWQTETVVAWANLLRRESTIPNRDELMTAAKNILRSKINLQGTAISLQGDLSWEAQWKLFTSKDQQLLGIFDFSMDEALWTEDVPRFARGIINSMHRGIWDTTTADAWAITYLKKFSGKFEAEKPGGLTEINFAGKKSQQDWSKSPKGQTFNFSWPGDAKTTAKTMTVEHSGAGKPWIQLETRAAIPLKTTLDLGYRVSRKLIPVVQSTPGVWTVGDVVNIELTVLAKYDHPWVVVRDPIPSGASHLGTGLEGSSAILDRDPKSKSSVLGVEVWPTEFEEKSNANFISYAAYLPKGTYKLNYRIRLNSSGDFILPQTHVEAMYSPETFGEEPNAVWKVGH